MPEKAKLSLFHLHILHSSFTKHSYKIYIFDSQSLALRFRCNLQASRRHFLKDKITTDEMAAEILLQNLTVVIFSYGYHR